MEMTSAPSRCRAAPRSPTPTLALTLFRTLTLHPPSTLALALTLHPNPIVTFTATFGPQPPSPSSSPGVTQRGARLADQARARPQLRQADAP